MSTSHFTPVSSTSNLQLLFQQTSTLQKILKKFAWAKIRWARIFPPRQRLTLAIGLSILTLIGLRPARADLVICNQSGEDLALSTMYHQSSNDAWTATGWRNLDNNECAHRLTFDLNETVYFHTRIGGVNGRTKHPLSGETTSFCVDTEDPFEILWDGDNSNPYYKDLRLGGGFKPCTDLHSDYREVPFRKITPSQNYDHCVVALGANGSHSALCFD